VPQDLEWRTLSPDLEGVLAAFFASLTDDDRRYFHPHPFTAEMAHSLCHRSGRDVYCVLTEGAAVRGYAMLRGWDEGYDIPSLGMIISADSRGQGLAQLVMTLLHATAKRRGAKRVRLKVYASNAPALRLYQSFGYQFGESENEQLVGYLNL
jgi:ribosomal-protein-alanine N-acetyltransferase